ncbi:hypothetical protein FJY63_00260 [Candidatus Sumerlaeota bacterium]|nr:hypothetical protein [Candidatus Sumerlaeota bacterium]
MSFAEVVEAADELSLEEQEMLIDVLHRRVIEARRREIARDIREAQQEYRKGRCRVVSPADLKKEIMSRGENV